MEMKVLVSFTPSMLFTESSTLSNTVSCVMIARS